MQTNTRAVREEWEKMFSHGEKTEQVIEWHRDIYRGDVKRDSRIETKHCAVCCFYLHYCLNYRSMPRSVCMRVLVCMSGCMSRWAGVDGSDVVLAAANRNCSQTSMVFSPNILHKTHCVNTLCMQVYIQTKQLLFFFSGPIPSKQRLHLQNWEMDMDIHATCIGHFHATTRQVVACKRCSVGTIP